MVIETPDKVSYTRSEKHYWCLESLEHITGKLNLGRIIETGKIHSSQNKIKERIQDKKKYRFCISIFQTVFSRNVSSHVRAKAKAKACIGIKSQQASKQAYQ